MKAAQLAVVLVMTVSTCACGSQHSVRALPSGTLPNDSRLGELRTLDSYFPMKVVESAHEWKLHQEQLKRQLRLATGLWPWPTKTALNTVIHGRIDMGDYSVEKVYFESIPRYFVTGNLYRPVGRTGKVPGVLCPHGHWARHDARLLDKGFEHARREVAAGAERFINAARNPVQARCVQLARMGCVVFQYDMSGYADSVQLPHRSGYRPDSCHDDNWAFSCPQAELRLQNTMGLQTWNSIRAIDFLLTLPEVDAERIAVTGASGGGTQTMMVTALDDRVAVSVPAVMVSTAMQGGCPCENAPYLRIDAGNIDIAALAAPRPLYVTGANDWTKEIETKGLPDLKKLYKMLGCENNVGGKALLHFGHNYNAVSRTLMYNWMNKHLHLGFTEPVLEKDFVLLKKQELSVWDDDHPAPSADKVGEAFEYTLLKWLDQDGQEKINALTPTNDESLQQYRRTVGSAWEIIIGRTVADVGEVVSTVVKQSSKNGFCQKVLFIDHLDEHEQLPAVLLEPETGKTNKVVIWIDEQGKSALFDSSGDIGPDIAGLLRRGNTVVGVDLLYQGEFLPDDISYEHARFFFKDGADLDEADVWKRNASYTFGYNRPLFAKRVHDILTTIKFATTSLENPGEICLVGLDKTAGPLVIAAAAMAKGTVAAEAAGT
jgi:dienelactone hydrolase